MPTYAATVGARTYRVTMRSGSSGARAELEGAVHTIVLVPRFGTTHFDLTVDGDVIPVVVRRQNDAVLVTLGADRFAVRVAPELPTVRRPPTAAARGTLQVVAPMPGLVVALEVQPGAAVEQGGPVAIMEAMKMQMEIRAPAAGRVQAVHVRPGQDVAGGMPLVTLET